LALGLLISTATRNQQASIQFALAIGLLPSFIFSGFIFPIENMPLFFRWFTMLFPQRWFLSISRLLFLSEAGFGVAFGGLAALLLFTSAVIFLAVKNSKTDVEL
jgi:ABC-2 type transport system permease protein